jgi:hypothetical protein
MTWAKTVRVNSGQQWAMMWVMMMLAMTWARGRMAAMTLVTAPAKGMVGTPAGRRGAPGGGCGGSGSGGGGGGSGGSRGGGNGGDGGCILQGSFAFF